MAEHEIGAGLADLGAVEQEPDVVLGGVLAAPFQAMLYRGEADLVAGGTVVNALLDCRVGMQLV